MRSNRCDGFLFLSNYSMSTPEILKLVIDANIIQMFQMLIELS
jgi:hypothetical protein